MKSDCLQHAVSQSYVKDNEPICYPLNQWKRTYSVVFKIFILGGT